MKTLPTRSFPEVSAPALVSVEHIQKTISGRAGRFVLLDNISFAVPASSLFAINGPSGSGKSTLLNILTGIDRSDSGKIHFLGKEMGHHSENQMARWRGKNIGIVFQFFQLLPTLTAKENVLIALELGGVLPRKNWELQTENCLQQVGMLDYADRLPNELSGGQQQRIAIARALANNPPVLIADEPTGNLDSKMAVQVFQLLEELVRQGKTVIYVTHDRSLAGRSSDFIELLDGRIVNASSRAYNKAV